MEKNMIEKYDNLLKFLEDIIKNENNLEVRNLAITNYITIIRNVAIAEKKPLSEYEYLMDRIAVKKSNSIPSMEVTDKEKLELYIYENVYKNDDRNISDGHERLIRKLREDFKNPNELSIKTWIKNYLEFIDQYDNILNKDKMIAYAKLVFKECDKDGKYYTNFDAYLKEIEDSKVTKLNVTNEQTKVNNDEIKSDVEKIEVSEDKDTTKETSEKKENIKNDTEEVKPLTIKSIKKPLLDQKTKNIIKVAAVIGAGIAYGPLGSLACYCIYKAYKQAKTIPEKYKNFMHKHGFSVNQNDELINSEGKVVTEAQVETERLGFVKSSLLKLQGTKEKSKGFFSNLYKKNRNALLLVKNKVSDGFKNIKNKLKSKDELEENINIDEENTMMHKGMGKC